MVGYQAGSDTFFREAPPLRADIHTGRIVPRRQKGSTRYPPSQVALQSVCGTPICRNTYPPAR
jgi:hypothetical protein